MALSQARFERAVTLIHDALVGRAAYGLPHAECRMSPPLADSMPLKDMADALGLQCDSVRKQLKSIYRKTATNRQPELVRLLMNLSASAAQRARKADGNTPKGCAS